jgi:hypothetical protein
MRSHKKRWLSRALFAAGLLTLGVFRVSATAISAQEAVVIDFVEAKDGLPQGWQLREHEGKADLALVPDGVSQVLRLRSKSSSFSLLKAVEIDLKRTPVLEWQWKVTELPNGGNFFARATDDQAAQLILAFSWGRFIAYIWDSTAPAGIMADAPIPPFRSVKAVVVQSGETNKGKWMTEMRNVVEDYKKLFGDQPEKVLGVMIQINSQHTRSGAEAYWRSIRFATHP